MILSRLSVLQPLRSRNLTVSALHPPPSPCWSDVLTSPHLCPPEETLNEAQSRHTSISEESIFPKDDPFACTLVPPAARIARRPRDSHHSLDSQSTLVPLYTIDEVPPSYSLYSTYSPTKSSYADPPSPSTSSPVTPFPSASSSPSSPTRGLRSAGPSLETLRGAVEDARMTRAWWLSSSQSSSSSVLGSEDIEMGIQRRDGLQEEVVAVPEAVHVSGSRRTSPSSGSWV